MLESNVGLQPQREQAKITDLEMTDTEYLQLLTQGRNPVQEQSYQLQLAGFGIPLEDARQLASLFDKPLPSQGEQILVAKALRHIWHQLINEPLRWRSNLRC
ncbi:hypothetical protein [Leptolyngbya sp. FACHB-261]|uniref:hypothetical protein n=1 Tax=Leptolyngbya sp. FACHB-261 TaxID=2692806 RepID=UPI0016834C7D|nr:hypothetical protein [Leptolyngbya sp. FACHB-261]MBD2105015.1 hypothetical protein [Leptolyngbya sp. FACHB-261]